MGCSNLISTSTVSSLCIENVIPNLIPFEQSFEKFWQVWLDCVKKSTPRRMSHLPSPSGVEWLRFCLIGNAIRLVFHCVLYLDEVSNRSSTNFSFLSVCCLFDLQSNSLVGSRLKSVTSAGFSGCKQWLPASTPMNTISVTLKFHSGQKHQHESRESLSISTEQSTNSLSLLFSPRFLPCQTLNTKNNKS